MAQITAVISASNSKRTGVFNKKITGGGDALAKRSGNFRRNGRSEQNHYRRYVVSDVAVFPPAVTAVWLSLDDELLLSAKRAIPMPTQRSAANFAGESTLSF